MTAPHAFITGGSSGIGLAVAKRLALKGWRLSLLARDEHKLEQAKNALALLRYRRGQCSSISEQIGAEPSVPIDILTLSADLTDPAQTVNAARHAIATMGAPQLLVNCAGMARPGHFIEMPLDIHRRTMDVNYFGTLTMIRALAPAMIDMGGGKIVLISSGAGLVGIFGYSAYSPTKFAVRGLAEVLRAELKPLGIRVFVVYPPDTDTPQLAEENRYKPPETRAITGSATTRSAEMVAAAILSGINKNRFLIAPGWEMALLARLHSLLGPVIHRYVDSVIRHKRALQAKQTTLLGIFNVRRRRP
ncbi:Fatty acyl-CoA reductase [Thiorhodovibrio winogradskyi]|uniref:3-dehydrosphinganine reductase n=1 Tax=Thiorhodovibrio winogradskyi TaxID=77007 RepID=A0ABZ0SEU8_9GAMM|nr:SDR family oxidoreductase [Thiorhodovibrio winogradskyi]